jgi:hypothetical protein
MPLAAKERLADSVVPNDGSRLDLEAAVRLMVPNFHPRA